MFGNLKEQQKQMAEKLSQIKLVSEAGNGTVKINCNAAGEIENLTIDPELMKEDVEQLEDMLIIAFNRAYQLMKETEQKEAQNMLKDMIPPGMEGLLGGL